MKTVSKIFASILNVEVSCVINKKVITQRVLVEDVTSDSLSLDVSVGEGGLRGVTPGTSLSLRFSYKGTTYLTSVEAKELRRAAKTLLVVSLPSDFEEVPQRQFFRVGVRVPVTSAQFSGTVTELSGSGCLVIVHDGEAPQAGTVVDLSISLEEDKTLVVSGRAIRIIDSDPARVAFSFVQPSERAQDIIIQYAITRQRELIQMGLGE